MCGVDVKHIVTIINFNCEPIIYDLKDFKKEKITFGRLNDNDIVLDSNLVSGHHGYFLVKEDKCIIYDDDSTNKIFINQTEIKNKELIEGEIIRIDNPDEPLNKGVLMFYSNVDNEKEDWKVYNLKKNKKTNIGKSKYNDIVLEHLMISDKAFEIYYNERLAFFGEISDHEKVYLNDKLVKTGDKIKEKDVIILGSTRLIFTNGLILYQTLTSGMSIVVSNITKVVENNKKEKTIVNDVSLDIKAGSLNAIIGGSGAGKSSLMNCISGQTSVTSGNVKINNVDLFENFSSLKKIIGYVPQQDIVYNDLTLYDLLYYSAELRLPSDINEKDKLKRINEVLNLVELDGKENTMVGMLSGGERKRASIAIELLSDPLLFFLDEPTSGLDPDTEKKLMITLKNLAQMGKTIVLVTHTPLNLHLCDKIIFMGYGGNLCFYGDEKTMLEDFKVESIVEVYGVINSNIEKYKIKEKLKEEFNDEENYVDEQNQNQNFKKHFKVLTKRYFKLIMNNKTRLMMLFLQIPAIVFLLSLVFNSDTFDNYDQAQAILFSLVCASLWLGLLNSIQEICKERTILKREYNSGLNLLAYFASKVVVLGTISLIQSILLISLFSIFCDLPDSFIFTNSTYLDMVLMSFLISFAITFTGLIVSIVSKTTEVAMTITPLILIPQLLFSGMLFKLEEFSETISVFVISKWGIEGYGIITNLNSLPIEGMDLYVRDEEVKYIFTIDAFNEKVKALLWITLVCAFIGYRLLKKSLKNK